MSLGPHASPGDRAGGAEKGGAVDFGALFQGSFRALWLVAYGVIQDAALAEDVLQEAALVALSKISAFRTGTSFTAWMAKIVRYVALNQARARRRRRTTPFDEAFTEPAAAAPSPAGLAGRQLSAGDLMASDQPHFDDRMVAALKKVADVPRTCLLLRTVEGLEYAEIARTLKIPEGTAMSHVHRTRQFLRQELADLRPAGTDEDGPNA